MQLEGILWPKFAKQISFSKDMHETMSSKDELRIWISGGRVSTIDNQNLGQSHLLLGSF